MKCARKGLAMDWKRKREIRLQYDIEANGYDELYSQEQRKKQDLAIDHLNALDGKDRILDSGCGTGDFLARVACNVDFAVGIDFSSKVLQRARLKLNRISNVDLVCADFDFLPFATRAFTHIFMFTALPAPAHWSIAIRQAREALTTTGILILSVPKSEISSEELVAKLKKSGLEPSELISQRETPDYVFIGEKTPRGGGLESTSCEGTIRVHSEHDSHLFRKAQTLLLTAGWPWGLFHI